MNEPDYYYLDSLGKEVLISLNQMPKKCGECPLCSSKETYSHYDDLDGFEVNNKQIICNANSMIIKSFRTEGSLGFDYGVEDWVLGKKPDDCPLYFKDTRNTQYSEINKKDWTNALKAARKATCDVKRRIEKKYKNPFSYAESQGLIDREKSAWLSILDIPRFYLTLDESIKLDHLIERSNRKNK